MQQRPGKARSNQHPRQVNVIRDTTMLFSDLWLEVYTAGETEHEDRLFAEMFIRARCTKADAPEDADMVVFGGGSDVNPMLYGEEPHCLTHFDTKRDERDIALYKKCLSLGIPMFGVCRGAQFLAVMNGLKLYQDIDGHTGNHMVYDVQEGKAVQNVSSVHHQSVIKPPMENKDFILVADCTKSTVRWLNASEQDTTGSMKDVEAFFIRSTCSLGVQGHPEYRGYYNFLQWTLAKIDKFIALNPDIEIRDGHKRMKVELMNARDDVILARQKAMN